MKLERLYNEKPSNRIEIKEINRKNCGYFQCFSLVRYAKKKHDMSF